jgi:hypothetical protein
MIGQSKLVAKLKTKATFRNVTFVDLMWLIGHNTLFSFQLYCVKVVHFIYLHKDKNRLVLLNYTDCPQTIHLKIKNKKPLAFFLQFYHTEHNKVN